MSVVSTTNASLIMKGPLLVSAFISLHHLQMYTASSTPLLVFE